MATHHFMCLNADSVTVQLYKNQEFYAGLLWEGGGGAVGDATFMGDNAKSQ